MKPTLFFFIRANTLLVTVEWDLVRGPVAAQSTSYTIFVTFVILHHFIPLEIKNFFVTIALLITYFKIRKQISNSSFNLMPTGVRKIHNSMAIQNE